jgi:leucyl/phenylalanyl-tRNA--protein transferase
MTIIDYLYSHRLNRDTLLLGYNNGFFPMGNPDSGEIDWHCPEQRVIIPFHEVRFSRSLRQTLKKGHFEFRFDTVFDHVIHSCSMRFDTWISEEIINSYNELHRLGFAHSVETWCDNELVGGLYGVAIGGAFFGESMFSRMNDASKAAFVALTERMNERGFMLLDSQYINPFTASLGAIEVSRYEYLTLLEKAVLLPCKLVD